MVLRRDDEGLLDGGAGEREDLVAALHQQGVDDGQGQGQLDGEDGALAHGGPDAHAAVELAHIGAHHVHAHAPAGDVRHLGGGGEPGRKISSISFFVGHGIGALRGEQALLHGLGADDGRDRCPCRRPRSPPRRCRPRGGPAGSRFRPRICPTSPASAGNSMPWSALLRMRWIIGSPSSSMMLLSISVSSPTSWRSIFLPLALARSRSMRGNLVKMVFTGTMRMPSTEAWISLLTWSR